MDQEPGTLKNSLCFERAQKGVTSRILKDYVKFRTPNFMTFSGRPEQYNISLMPSTLPALKRWAAKFPQAVVFGSAGDSLFSTQGFLEALTSSRSTPLNAVTTSKRDFNYYRDLYYHKLITSQSLGGNSINQPLSLELAAIRTDMLTFYFRESLEYALKDPLLERFFYDPLGPEPEVNSADLAAGVTLLFKNPPRLFLPNGVHPQGSFILSLSLLTDALGKDSSAKPYAIVSEETFPLELLSYTSSLRLETSAVNIPLLELLLDRFLVEDEVGDLLSYRIARSFDRATQSVKALN